jgi:hypothetical protein
MFVFKKISFSTLLSISFFLTIFFIGSPKAEAANRYWVGNNGSSVASSTSWSTTSGGTSGATVPGASDVAIFNYGTNTALVDLNWSVSGLIMASSYSGIIGVNVGQTLTVGSGNYNQAGGIFNANGILVVNGSFMISTGTITGNVSILGNLTQTGGDMSTVNLTLKSNGGANQNSYVDVNSNLTVASLNINKNKHWNGASCLYIANNDILNVNGTVTFNDGYYLIAVGYSGKIKALGNVVINSAWGGSTGFNPDGAIIFGGAGNQSFSMATTSTYFGGSVTVDKPSGKLIVSSTSTLDIHGSLILNQGVIVGDVSVLGGLTQTNGDMSDVNLTFKAFGAHQHSYVDVNSSLTLASLYINKIDHWNGGSQLFIATGDVLKVTGTTTLKRGFFGTALNYLGKIESLGNVVVNSPWNGGTGNITLAGTNDQIFARSAILAGPVTVDKSNGIIQLIGTSTINNLMVATGTVDFAGNNLTVGSTASFVIGAGGVLRLQGNETVTTPTLLSGSTVEYYGTTTPVTVKN